MSLRDALMIIAAMVFGATVGRNWFKAIEQQLRAWRLRRALHRVALYLQAHPRQSRAFNRQ